ncbi:TPA: sensor histidine kinase [Streptococcus suis]|nr:sensor histidine kinase [Streptococcus suis]
MIFEKRKVPLMFFVGMVFLYFPFYYAQYSPNPTAVVLATILFALVYCSLFYTDHKLYSLLAWFYLIGYIAVMSFWGNLQFSLFIFNLSNMLGWYYKETRPTYRTVSYGILLLAIILWALFGPVPFEMRAFALVIHFFGLALLIFSWIEIKREALQQRLQEQNASINLLLAENERNRIGQDLHDTLGHVFAMLSVKAELVQTLLDHDQIDQAKKEVQELQILQQMLDLAGVDLLVLGGEIAEHLSLPVQNKLAMVLRELGNNLLKHSQASKCRLVFEKDQQELVLYYEDNGVGFAQLTGQELHTIKDRLVTVKGSLEFLSLANPTRLFIRIPLEEVVE